MLFKEDRLKRIKETVEDSKTLQQFQTRKETVQRLKQVLAQSKDDEDFYARAWMEFPVWCAAFIDDDDGKLLVPGALADYFL